MSKRAVSSFTAASPSVSCSKMARRLGSASAWKTAFSLSTRTYKLILIDCQPSKIRCVGPSEHAHDAGAAGHRHDRAPRVPRGVAILLVRVPLSDSGRRLGEDLRLLNRDPGNECVPPRREVLVSGPQHDGRGEIEGRADDLRIPRAGLLLLVGTLS